MDRSSQGTKKSPVRSFMAVVLLLILLFAAAVAGYLGLRLAKYPYTNIYDMKGILAVNTGRSYFVTYTGDEFENGYESMSECCDREIKQCLIVKDFSAIDEYLSENGCEEYDRMGDRGYYTTADGRRFIGTYGMRCIPVYCTFIIEGVAAEEINGE